MLVKLENIDNQLTISNISGNGIIISDNNSKIDKIDNIDINTTFLSNTLINALNTLPNKITTLQSNLANLQTIVAGLQTENYTVQSYILNITDSDSWTELTSAGTPNIIDIACSGDGKYIFVCPWSRGVAQFSTDYGVTWSTPSGISNFINSCSMNSDGKYIIISDYNNYKISTNYGQTFIMPSSRPFQLQRSALSASGKYIVCGCGSGQGLQVSNDYGSTWTQRETSVWTWNDVAISLNGSVIYGASDSLIKKSTDHGQTWSTIYTNSSSNSFKSMCCSNDGQYILVSFSPFLPSFPTTNKLLLSTDHGATFNLVGTSASYYNVAMDKNGINMIASTFYAGLYYSTNSGSTWTHLSSIPSNNSSNIQTTAIAMSYGGDYIYSVSPDQKPLRRVNTTLIV